MPCLDCGAWVSESLWLSGVSDNLIYAENGWKCVCNKCRHTRNLENNVVLCRNELDNVTQTLQRVKSEDDRLRQVSMQSNRLSTVGGRKFNLSWFLMRRRSLFGSCLRRM